MPLVRIDLNEGRTADDLAAIGDSIHQAIVDVYGIPERDLFHIITEHRAGEIKAQDAGLGFDRSNDIVMIQIFTQRGRSQAAKDLLFEQIAAKLGEIGIGGADVFIGYIENDPGDWSFGFGKAQYITGELAVPGH